MRWHNGIVRLRAERAAVGFVQATITRDTSDVARLIGVPWQRRGSAIEAASVLCGWLSSQGVLHLTAHIHPVHAPSAQVARSLGMVTTRVLVSDGEEICSGPLSPRRVPGE